LATKVAAAIGRRRAAWDYRIATGTSVCVVDTEAFASDDEQERGSRLLLSD
jgi:hypothetical protein